MEDTLSKIGVLNGTVLKLIAVISMTIDHLGFIFFPQLIWMRALGRLAFPIFAYMIAEGCYYTKNKKKYFFMVLGIGVLCQAAMVIFQNSWNLNIMFTLALSILLIFAMQWAIGGRSLFDAEKTASEKTDASDGHPASSQTQAVYPAYAPARWAVFFLILAVCIFLDYGLTKLCPGFKLDYGLFGILLPGAIYVCPKKYQKLIAALVFMALVAAVRGFAIQWWSLFAIIPIALYNGKPGRYRLKYFFYLYYPLHLALLWGIKLFG